MDTKEKMSARLPQNSREAILTAFKEIVLAQKFANVRVVEVVRRAGVARSTFYEHFQNTDDLLRETLRAPFAALAATARGESTNGALEFVLTHFLERRADALALLDGENGSTVRNALADAIGGSPIAACAMAGAQLATIGAWLEGRLQLSVRSLAEILERMPLSPGLAYKRSAK